MDSPEKRQHASELEFRRSIFLEQLKARGVVYNSSNLATIEYGKMALRGCFLLNGAAAVAILGSGNPRLLEDVKYFAIGALLSVFATGISYLSQYFIAESWKSSIFTPPHNDIAVNESAKYDTLYSKIGIVLTVLSSLAIILAYASFSFGVYQCNDKICVQKASIACTEIVFT
ncbi:hypothetical protein [Nitratidesulfovibrio sp. 1201_IL3209]|uniref:hypothetical protein n=1 Tax=Nitratidesulfovibrio sp. 1201_IL3209 TaxID=3084053 RepID=UPI002FDB4F47